MIPVPPLVPACKQRQRKITKERRCNISYIATTAVVLPQDTSHQLEPELHPTLPEFRSTAGVTHSLDIWISTCLGVLPYLCGFTIYPEPLPTL